MEIVYWVAQAPLPWDRVPQKFLRWALHMHSPHVVFGFLKALPMCWDSFGFRTMGMKIDVFLHVSIYTVCQAQSSFVVGGAALPDSRRGLSTDAPKFVVNIKEYNHKPND